MNLPQLDVRELGCARGQRTLFSGVNFGLSAGEWLLIEGDNGSGKTSLLRLLAGLASPKTGAILWQQQDIVETMAIWRTRLHYLAHAGGLKSGLTVVENLQLATQLAGVGQFQPTPDLLQSLQLHACQHQLVRFLSAGQQRRVALARLFLIKKAIWLLDEPLTALDTTTQAFLLAQMHAHLDQGGLLILSSHQPLTLPGSPPPHRLRLSAC